MAILLPGGIVSYSDVCKLLRRPVVDRKSNTLLCDPALYLWRGLRSSVTFAPNGRPAHVHAFRRCGEVHICSPHPDSVNRWVRLTQNFPDFTNHSPPRWTPRQGSPTPLGAQTKSLCSDTVVRTRHSEQAADAPERSLLLQVGQGASCFAG